MININQQFPDIAAHIAEAMQQLGNLSDHSLHNIEQAAAHIANQLIADHKLMVAGTVGVAHLGHGFCFNLLHRYAEQRPALPAIALPDCIDLQKAEYRQGSSLRLHTAEALGSSGDVLLLLSDQHWQDISQDLDNLYANRGITSVVLYPQDTSQTTNFDSQTIYIPLESDNIARMHELTLFILNCLGDMIESHVFGGS